MLKTSNGLLVNYATFKQAAVNSTVYYIILSNGYYAFCANQGRLFRSFIASSPNITDFNTNIKPTAILTSGESDALRLAAISAQGEEINNSSAAAEEERIVHYNSTIASSGNKIYTDFESGKIDLIINIVNSPTGTNPGIVFSIQEIDPGNRTTTIGSPVSTISLNSTGITNLSFTFTYSNSIKINWTVSGINPSFTGIYATVIAKPILSIQGIPNGVTIPISGSITAQSASAGTVGQAHSSSATMMGGDDGALLQSIRVYDIDTHPITNEYSLGVHLRAPGSGGSTVIGTASSPIRTDPTGTTTQPISATALPLPTGAASETTLTTLSNKFNTLGQKAMTGSVPVTLASDQSILSMKKNNFTSLLKFEPSVGEELRSDETSSDRYHGRATDGTATSNTSWEVVRFYKNASGEITRIRYRNGISWDDRANSLNWI